MESLKILTLEEMMDRKVSYPRPERTRCKVECYQRGYYDFCYTHLYSVLCPTFYALYQRLTKEQRRVLQ